MAGSAATKEESFQRRKTYRPVDDQVVGCCASTNHIARVLVRHILGGEAHLGVAGGQAVADLVPGNHPEGVVGPRRHGHLEGGRRGRDKVGGGLPGVGDEGGVVLDLVGENRGPVVASRLPHHAGILAVALNPKQVWRVRHILHNQCRRLLVFIELCFGLAGVASRVQFCRLCDCETVVICLDEPWLSFKVNPASVFLPVDCEL